MLQDTGTEKERQTDSEGEPEQQLEALASLLS